MSVDEQGLLEAIEGSKLDLNARKLTTRPPFRENGQKRVGFKLSIHAEAEVVEDLGGAAPQNPSSARSVGDRISAQTIEGSANKLSKPEVYQKSAGHKGTRLAAKGKAIAKVTVPLRTVLGVESR